MKKELLPDFAKPYKTKGFDVRLVRGSYQLFKISSQRVPEKSYPVLTQTYIGTITPEHGLIPKKVKVEATQAFVEYGLSHFILARYKSELLGCLFNSGTIQTVYMGIVKFLFGHADQRFIKLTYLKRGIRECPELQGSGAAKRIEKIASKIASLLKKDIPDEADRDFVIAVLKGIRTDASSAKPAITYPDELKSLFTQYRIDYE